VRGTTENMSEGERVKERNDERNNETKREADKCIYREREKGERRVSGLRKEPASTPDSSDHTHTWLLGAPVPTAWERVIYPPLI